MDPSSETMELGGNKNEQKKRLQRGVWHLKNKDAGLKFKQLLHINSLSLLKLELEFALGTSRSQILLSWPGQVLVRSFNA